MPRGRVLVGSDCLGISFLRTGLGLYPCLLPLTMYRIFAVTSSDDNFPISFMVTPSVPGVLLPLFALILRYASRIFSLLKISGIREENVSPCVLC